MIKENDVIWHIHAVSESYQILIRSEIPYSSYYGYHFRSKDTRIEAWLPRGQLIINLSKFYKENTNDAFIGFHFKSYLIKELNRWQRTVIANKISLYSSKDNRNWYSYFVKELNEIPHRDRLLLTNLTEHLA